jgi:hypothetical protein
MSEKITLSKNVYSKTQFEKTVDTSFSQLTLTTSGSIAPNTPSVDEFFTYYRELFFTIPKEGEINSHRYLVNTSGEYIGNTDTSVEVQALLEEVNSLRSQILTQQELLLTLRSTQDTLARTTP